MNSQTELWPVLIQAKKPDKPASPFHYTVAQFKITSLRECGVPRSLVCCDGPEKCYEYHKTVIATDAYYTPEVESFYVLLLNTRRRALGHALIATGTLDTIFVMPRDVFRIPMLAGASAIVLMHNHPSGDPTPSEADIKVTRDLIRGGNMLKIDVLDHVIAGEVLAGQIKPFSSLRELGYFASTQ